MTNSTGLNSGPFQLTGDQVRRLRTDHPYGEDLAWVADIVSKDGWLPANVQYLHRERERSAEAMRALMRELGVRRVTWCQGALDLIQLACGVFAPESGFPGTTTRASECELRIENERCAVYQSLEDRHWLGVTACPSWHRRRGWIDAMGVLATDTILAERKWGDPACVTMIEIKRPAVAQRHRATAHAEQA